MRGLAAARRYSRRVPYEVTTPVFEGPFDLLLHLITKEQVDIYEVSISTIVDAYVAELERIQGLDLDVATEFLLIASILVELKARRLLPGRDDVDLDEELALWEERDLLVARLLECKTFKDAASALERLASRAQLSYPRRAGLDEAYLGLAPDLLAGVTADQLRDAFIRAATPKPPPRVDLDHVAPIRISVRDTVDELVSRLPRLGPVSFRTLTRGLTERLVVIVHFLAVLELCKQGFVDLDQGEVFGDLQVTWVGEAGDGADIDAVEEYSG